MQFYTPAPQKNTSFSKRLMTWSALFVVSMSGVLTFSETAHAGLLSYINSLFGSEQVSANVRDGYLVANSQISSAVILPRPATNYNPNPEKSSGVSPLVGDVLISDLVFSESSSGDMTNTQISSYIVRDGDTYASVAKMFNVSVNTILWANDLSRNSTLRVGQVIIILPVTGITYTIKKGDTIRGISLKYKADIDEILAYNDLSLDSALHIGDTIIIPDAELQVSIPTRIAVVAGSNPAHDTNGPDYVGYYIRPVVSGRKTQGLHGYNGVDIAAPIGTPIVASAAGTVLLSSSGGWNGGYGNLVIISHGNGTQTVYGHLSKNIVSVGQHVEQGQTIGLMGRTGKATGSHVHFEIRGAKNPF